MPPRRSGAPSRFLVFRAPQHWARLLSFVGINLLFGVLPLLSALVGFAIWGGAAVEALLDPRDPIQRLSRPLSADEAARGEVRVSGRVDGREVCVVTHEHQEKDWVEDWHVVDAEGASLVVVRAEGEGAPAPGETIPITWESASWEPRLARSESKRAWWWRSHQRGVPEDGRVLEGCLRPGDPLFVDITPAGQAPAFSMQSALGSPVLTPGDGTARLRLAELVAAAAGHVSPLAFSILLALLCGWRLAAARPVADALVRRIGQPPVPAAARPALAALLATPLALAGFLFCYAFAHDAPAHVDRWGWVGAHFAAMAAVVVALRMGDRRAALSAAMNLVKKARRPALDRAREGEALGLDLTVDPEAPLGYGLLSDKRHAHWSVQVTRVLKDASEAAPSREGPSPVPVLGKGGAALLDLTHVAADVRAVRRVVGPFWIRRGRYAPIVGPAPPPGSTYVLEERFLDRGEALHVIGRVVRFSAAGDAQVPVLGGTATEPLVVHAGSRRSLLDGLRTELRFLTGARAASVAVALAMAALAGYLESR